MIAARILLTLILNSSVAVASNFRTDVLLFVPKQIGKSAAAESKGTHRYQVDALTTPGNVPVNIEDLTVDTNYQLRNLDLLDKGEFQTKFEVSKITASMKALHVDSVTDQLVNGVIVRVRVKLDCENVVIESRSPLSVNGNGRLSNSPLTALIDNLSWTSPASQWQVRTASCTGATDAAFIETQLNSIWLQSPLLKAKILELANLKLSSWVQNKLVWAKDFPNLPLQFYTRVEEFVDNGKAWVLRFSFNAQSQKPCPTFENEPTIEAPKITSASDSLEFQMNVRLVSQVASCLHEMGQLNRQDYTRSLAGFQDLLKSTWKLNAVWPDLIRFPLGANFLISSQTVGNFNLYSKNVPADVAAATPNTIFFNLFTTIESAMLYLKGEDIQPYMTFTSVMRGAAALSTRVTNKITEVTLKWYGTPTLKATYQWNVPPSNPKIDTEAIAGALVDTIQPSKISFTLTPFMLTDTHQISINGLLRNGLLMKIPLQLDSR